MSEFKQTPGPEVQTSPERTTRENYMVALQTSLGVEDKLARPISNHLLDQADLFAGIDYKRDKRELEPKDVAKIEAIGTYFLIGSPQQDQLKYTVGSRVISLLREEPQSGYFTKLDSWVDYWTDGTAGEKFRQMIGKSGK